MSLPQDPPTIWDKAREAWFLGSVVTTKPETYNGFSRKPGEADDSWYPDVIYMMAYPEAAPTIDPNDPPAVAAWLRIREAFRAQQYKTKNPGQTYDPGKPTWPLPSAPANWKGGGAFGAKRPWSKPQTRWHTGIDLGAPAGLAVLAPEAGTIVAPNSGWESRVLNGKVVGVKALILQTDSGKTLLLGGIRPGSAIVTPGQKVIAGQKVAEVGTYEGGDSMVHFQMYEGHLTEAQVNARKSWKLGGAKPDKLLDPTDYLKAAMKNPKFIAMMAVPFEASEENGEVDEGTPEGDVANTEDTAPDKSGAGAGAGASQPTGGGSGGVIAGVVVAVLVLGGLFATRGR